MAENKTTKQNKTGCARNDIRAHPVFLCKQKKMPHNPLRSIPRTFLLSVAGPSHPMDLFQTDGAPLGRVFASHAQNTEMQYVCRSKFCTTVQYSTVKGMCGWIPGENVRVFIQAICMCSKGTHTNTPEIVPWFRFRSGKNRGPRGGALC